MNIRLFSNLEKKENFNSNRMKKKILLYIIICIQGGLYAQDIISYDGSFRGSGTIKACEGFVLKPGFTFTASSGRSLSLSIDRAVCSPYTQETAVGSNQNYIITVTPTAPTDKVSISNGSIEVKRGASYQTSIQYFDGLGRPTQTVHKGVTPAGNDLVSHIEYDGFGREYQQWLPVPISNNNGTFVQASDIKNAATGYEHYNEGKPYTEIIYEASPLNRVMGQKSPGEAWHRRPTSISYQTNTSNEVKCFYVNTSGNLQRGSNYAATTLYKTVSTDEDGKTAAEYKDKLGWVVMTRQASNHDTYYVYNDLGQLAYVLPPLAADALGTGGYSDNHTVLKQYAYVYKYDDRGNQIYKRLPGCDSIIMVYDKADRLILSQDGNQRNKKDAQQRNKWILYKYDQLGRMLYSSEIDLKGEHNSLIEYFKSYVITETFTASTQPYPFADTGYSCGWYHAVPLKLLTVNYYDTYEFLQLLPNAAKTALTYLAKTGYDKQYKNAKGLLTGTRTYLLDGSGEYTSTAYYYDYRGHVVQTRSTNHLGGYDFVYSAYNFTGGVTKSLKEHSISTTLNNPLTELYEYTYDHAGRLIDTNYKKGNTQVLLSKNEYDELGRLKTKKRHNNTDIEQFEYNIRNWTTRITSGSFTQSIYYQSQPGSGNLSYFNGNISSVSYSGQPYDEDYYSHGYSFKYDELNRLTAAGKAYNGRRHNSERFEYDKQGNITTLVRRMPDGLMIDSLYFQYTGNQLKTIDDYNTTYTGAIYGLKEYADIHNTKTNGQTTFLFDANGNMTTDLDRNIVTIRYNLLNLPDTVQFKNGNQIINTYDVSGRKLRTAYKISLISANIPLGDIYSGNATQFRNDGEVVYINNFEYTALLNAQGGLRYYQLDKTHHAEGYNGKYFRRDHLGNVREVWNTEYDYALGASNTTPQITNYYPSGLPWYDGKGADVQPYKHNGCEFIEMHGYDVTDHGNRGLYHAINRYTTMDRFAEKFPWQSPYVHAGNNPVNYVDVGGDSISFTGNNIQETLNAIYHGLADGTNITMKFNNGVLDPTSIQEQAQNTTDFFLQDLYEIAINPTMVELSTSNKNTYMMNEQKITENFTAPADVNTSDFGPQYESLLKSWGEPSGLSISGNLGQTLIPGNVSASGKSSTNNNVQVIINGTGSLNHRAVGIAHEFGHVILYLRGLPYGHTQPGVDPFVYGRSTIMSKRLGYDF